MQINLEEIIEHFRQTTNSVKEFLEYTLTPLKTLTHYTKQPYKDARLIKYGKNYLNLAEGLQEFINRKDYSETKTNDLLDRFKKSETTAEQLNIYCITQDYGFHYWNRFSDSNVYYDGLYAFVLCAKLNTPLALISFKPEKNAINIVQIQGVYGERQKLKLIKWERMMLALAYEWAQQYSINEVRVTPHKQNEWTKVREKGKIRYDVTAKRTGFKYDSTTKKYVKKTN